MGNGFLQARAQLLRLTAQHDPVARAARNLSAVNTRSMDAPQERRELMMKRLIADRAADLPRLREIIKVHPTVRTGNARCILLLRVLLLIAAKQSLQEVIRRNILLLRTKDRRTVARGAAHTYILFTLAARPDLHDVHNRLVAAAFLTDHQCVLPNGLRSPLSMLSNGYVNFSSVKNIVFNIWTRSFASSDSA